MAKNKKKNKNSKPNAQQVKNVQVEETVLEENVEVIEPDTVEEKVEEKNSKAEKEAQKAKNDKNSKPKKEKKSLGTKMKEVHSELKKVSWPKFSKVVKTTGVVIFVVLVCMLLLFGIDMAFKYGIYDQIIG